jgi:hypothetical protein
MEEENELLSLCSIAGGRNGFLARLITLR